MLVGEPAPPDATVTIPDRAMLQPVELYGATPAAVEDISWAKLRPPQPCADGVYASSVLCRGGRAISAEVHVNGTPAVAVEYVAVYRSGGAGRYVRELHRALDGRRGIDAQGSWKILSTGVAGPESLLLRLRPRRETADRAAENTFIAVAGTERVLVVVAGMGGTAGEGHRRLVAQLINPALRRASLELDREAMDGPSRPAGGRPPVQR